MSGAGANSVLDKAFMVLSTYNSSAAAGVLAFRCVKFAAGGTIDICTADTDRFLGIVQESVDAAKVLTTKVAADVRLAGISTTFVTTAASIVLGSPVTMSTAGGVKLAASGDIPIGMAVGITGTIADSNLIQVLLTPGLALLA